MDQRRGARPTECCSAKREGRSCISQERGEVLHQPREGRSCISREGRSCISQEKGDPASAKREGRSCLSRERGGPAVCTNKGLPEGIVQSEKRQAEKDKYHAISLFLKSKKVQLLETESRRLVSRD